MHIRLIDAAGLAALVQDQPSPALAFLQYLRKWRNSDKESLLWLVWDGVANWRRQLDKQYRQHAQGLAAQDWPGLAATLACIPLVNTAHPDMEARDLAYALSYELAKQGHLVTLSSNDGAWLECIRARVQWQGFKRTETVDDQSFRKQTSCPRPEAWPEARALAGSRFDTLTGVPGLSEVRAKALITEYGSVASFWKQAEDVLFAAEQDWLAAALPASKQIVERNIRLLRLSAAVAPDPSKAVTWTSEFLELELYDALEADKAGLTCDEYLALFKPFSQDVSKGEDSLARRTVLAMNKSYGKGR